MKAKRKTLRVDTERASARLKIKVAPKSARSGVNGWMSDTLKLRVTAAPERGKANQAVCALLAEELEIAKEKIRIVRGAGSTRKLIKIDGLNMAEIRRRLIKKTKGNSE